MIYAMNQVYLGWKIESFIVGTHLLMTHASIYTVFSASHLFWNNASPCGQGEGLYTIQPVLVHGCN